MIAIIIITAGIAAPPVISRPIENVTVAITTHPREVLIGDPVYIEVTIINTGSEAVLLIPPSRNLGTLRFETFDPQNALVFRELGGGAIGAARIRYDPMKPVRRYWYLFSPGLRWVHNDFWTKERGLYLSAVYRLNERLSQPAVELRSSAADLVVQPRSDAELRVLERWTWLDPHSHFNGPSPNSFGLHFGANLGPEDTRRLANQLQPGEFRDLLDLAMQLQALYLLPPAERGPGDAALVAWLERQPDIKRQALTEKTWSIAAGSNMPSTAAALQASIHRSPVREKEACP